MALEDEVLSRQMPHDLDAEQAVLGSMLFDAECIKDVMDKLLPEDFYLKQNRDIFTVAYNMFSFSKPIDPLTLAEEMRKSGVYDEQTTRSYLAQLVDFTFSSANVMDYVKILRDKSLLRGLSRAAGEIDTMVQEGLGEASAILEAAEQKVYAIRRGRSAQELVPISQLIVPFLDRLGELSEGKSGLPGLPSGFSAVDQKIHGLNKSDLVLLAARPGVGKSSFALNMALNVAKQSGKTVAIFSLEMSREQLLVRLMSSEGLVDLGRLMTGRLSPSDWVLGHDLEHPGDVADRLLPVLPGVALSPGGGHELEIVDDDQAQVLQAAALGVHVRGGEHGVVVDADVRLPKDPARLSDLPPVRGAQPPGHEAAHMLSDLRDSGAIEQDADIVMFLYREDYYKDDTDKKNIAECIVAKNRHGETGKVPLRWSPEYTTFSTVEMRYDEDDY